MGFLDAIKVRAAIAKHQKGDIEGALAEYEKLFEAGVYHATYLLPYSVLLLRRGGEENYLKVKELLKRAQKASDLTADRKQQLFSNYAVAQYKLGEIEKAINLLEASHRKAPCGLSYQTLGYLYIESGDAEKALAFNQEALDYDDEDSIVLDNMGQTYYRLLGDKETAKGYFEKAIAIKDSQIDTLYFLSRYDLDNGDRQAALEKLETAVEGRFSPLNFISKEEVEQEIARLKTV